MGTATNEHADLLLKLYDLRREARMRQAREWFIPFCHAASYEESMQKFPFGSVENTNIRMVTSYWEMVASIANRGLIDEDLFFENSTEMWIVYDRIKAWLPGQRAAFNNPHNFEQLERLAKRFEAWQEQRSPGALETLRERLRAAGARAKVASE